MDRLKIRPEDLQETARLPITHVIPDIRRVTETESCAVIQAPPGAGKTTLVPLALVNESWLSGRKIVMLEPRRLAAGTAAGRMADLLGEPVGRTVGYHIRMERKTGPDTRIEVVTEGILTRRIQSDPSLEGTGLVIFDEFHERNLNSDLGLALCLEILEGLREDLRILVMSATLDTAPVSALLGDAPVIVSEGKMWPVETRYLPEKKSGRNFAGIEWHCAGAVQHALSHDDGDILVFLPGAGEIRRVETLLRECTVSSDLSIMPLYGNLSQKDQNAAIQPSCPGRRKVVLATAIAETSLTIDGIRIVVDSGLMRVPKFSPGSGMSRLETVPVTIASADQRRGRAGRTGPGICYRLWSEECGHTFRRFNTPEILNADLAGPALELAVWGVSDAGVLKWLDPPPEGGFLQARSLLTDLGALDADGAVTSHGKALVSLGVHPRLGHMLVKGKEAGNGSLACRMAALLSERDILLFQDGFRDADIRLRLEILEAAANGRACTIRGGAIHRAAVATVLKNARRFEKKLDIRPGRMDIEAAGRLLAFAYPERIAMARAGGNGKFHMASGFGAFLDETDPLASEKFIVAARLDGNRTHARIYLAAPYSMQILESDFGHRIETRETTAWEKRTGTITAKKERIYGQLMLKQAPLPHPDPDAVRSAMIDVIRRQGLDVLPWTREQRRFQARVMFLKTVGGFDDLPDLSDTALSKHLETWLGPFLTGVSSLNRLKALDLKPIFGSQLTWSQRQLIDKQAPSRLTVPGGSRIALDYGTGKSSPCEAPVLAVRLQAMFGLQETPRVAGGRIPVILHLLSPAGRPMQVTRDLAGFWKNTYHDVKKDLKGRYPKHHWPDDPLTAEPA